MRNKIIALSILLSLTPPIAYSKDDNTSRDAFVRDIIISLIENKASHIDTAQHVETAYAAWQRYQELVAQDSKRILPKDFDKSIEIAEE